MNYKTLVKRFAKACYRFEALQENLDILLFDTDDEIKYNEYEDLASQAAEIVLKLSANGHNVGVHFFDYYVRRLEYIVAYFRELFDDEETPLTEDEQDAQSDEVDNENDTQTAESDDAAGDIDRDALCSPDEEPGMCGFKKLSPEDQDRMRDTTFIWYDMNVITGRYVGGGKRLPTAGILSRGSDFCNAFTKAVLFGSATEILAGEIEVRRIIWEAIDAIPGFRDSEEFKELIEKYPTYKEKEQ